MIQNCAGSGSRCQRNRCVYQTVLNDTERLAVGYDDRTGAVLTLDNQLASRYRGAAIVSIRAGKNQCAATELGQCTSRARNSVGEPNSESGRNVKVKLLARRSIKTSRIVKRVGG
jgi:hypothetical protein